MGYKRPAPNGYCVYCTTHEDGRFYIGKGITRKVLAGTYKGSGTKISFALKKNWDAWTSSIIQDNLTNEQALELEEKLVEGYLGQSLCMNLDKGGGRKQEGDGEYQRKRGEKIAESRKKRIAEDPAYKEQLMGYFAKAHAAIREKCASTPFSFTWAGVQYEEIDRDVLLSKAEALGLLLVKGEGCAFKELTAIPKYIVEAAPDRHWNSKQEVYEYFKELACDFTLEHKGARRQVVFHIVPDSIGWWRWTSPLPSRCPAVVKLLDGKKYRNMEEIRALKVPFKKIATNTYVTVPRKPIGRPRKCNADVQASGRG